MGKMNVDKISFKKIKWNYKTFFSIISELIRKVILININLL